MNLHTHKHRRARLVQACELRTHKHWPEGMVRVEYRSTIDLHHVVASCTTYQRNVWHAALVVITTVRYRLAQIGGVA